MKIFLDVIGCRLNQSEIEGFANYLNALDHQIIPEPADADVAIVNTCAVTVKAAADSRKQIRRASREGAKTVIVTGCWATLEPEAAQELPGVSKVYVNAHKDDLLPELLNKTAAEISAIDFIRTPLPGKHAKTRAFIRVQEGCDNHCTYCLTRIVRGSSRSRGLAEIHKDIQAALAGGTQEIVLTGVQLGGWGRDFNSPRNLSDLLATILNNPRVPRVRLSSIEPWEIDVDMLSLWEDPRLCRHLHIPLQSGSDRILRRMARPISSDDYLNLVERITTEIPDIALTTDVIAGFPGEDERDFERTKALVNAVGFAGGHVFTYSPRPKTAAYRMEGCVPRSTAKARNAELRDLFRQTSQSFRDRFIGRTLTVLWESSELGKDGSWQLSGLTDNYIRVEATDEANLWNTITPVRISAHHPSRVALLGTIHDEPVEMMASGA